MVCDNAYPPAFHVLGCHDDDVRVLLVHHLPEVHHRVLQAALRGNEHLALGAGLALLPEALERSARSERSGLPTDTMSRDAALSVVDLPLSD